MLPVFAVIVIAAVVCSAGIVRFAAGVKLGGAAIRWSLVRMRKGLCGLSGWHDGLGLEGFFL